MREGMSLLGQQCLTSTNPIHGKVYSIQHYVIKFGSDLRQVGGFLRVLRFLPPKQKTDATSPVFLVFFCVYFFFWLFRFVNFCFVCLTTWKLFWWLIDYFLASSEQYFSYIQLYCGVSFLFWWKKPEYPEKTTDLSHRKRVGSF
jgi:hypothetical protein